MAENIEPNTIFLEWFDQKIEGGATYYVRVYVVNREGQMQSEVGTQVASVVTKA